MQPTTFKPGHWRFQCVMVVGPEFDGKMRWTLTYAGTTTGTSERMLQSNWNLVEGAAELGKIDLRESAARRLPQSRAAGARPRHHAAARPAADADGDSRRGAAHLRQRARRGACRAGRTSWSAGRCWQVPGPVTFLRPARRAHQSHVFSARHLRARTDRDRLRIHIANAAEREREVAASCAHRPLRRRYRLSAVGNRRFDDIYWIRFAMAGAAKSAWLFILIFSVWTELSATRADMRA